MAEDPPPLSLKDRIAALNLSQVGHSQNSNSPKPPVPTQSRQSPASSRPSFDHRRQSANNPPITSIQPIGNEPAGSRNNGVLPPPTVHLNGGANNKPTKPSLPPRLPPRTPSVGAPPTLPPRRPSETPSRRESFESTSSAISNVSSVPSTNTVLTTGSRSSTKDTPYKIKAPAFDAASLPPLPPKRPQKDPPPKRAPLKPTASVSAVPQIRKESVTSITPAPNPPPRIPPRTKSTDATSAASVISPTSVSPAKPRRSALDYALNTSTEKPPPVPSSRPSDIIERPASEGPPPIPFSSRPKPGQQTFCSYEAQSNGSQTSCLKCRDFSAPDKHATSFSRFSLPQHDTLRYLSNALTSPFPSPTDKARAIFAWLHHNVAYDTKAFFSNNVRPSTPSSTLHSGLAVCEGYAGLFAALATLAGLECIVVGGHGKGFGFAPLAPNSSVPPFAGNHAWNAIRLPDSGEPDPGNWKLIDSCWGSGVVQGANMPYQPRFAPSLFTMSNAEFALRHFPSDPAHFFLPAPPPTWAEYILPDPRGNPPQMFGSPADDHGLGERSFTPGHAPIRLSTLHPSEMVRFSFAFKCPHYQPTVHGSGPRYPFILSVHPGGRDDVVAFNCAPDGRSWFLDVPVADLGRKGQTVSVCAVNNIGGRDARGVTEEEWKAKKGRVGMGWSGVCGWELA